MRVFLATIGEHISADGDRCHLSLLLAHPLGKQPPVVRVLVINIDSVKVASAVVAADHHEGVLVWEAGAAHYEVW